MKRSVLITVVCAGLVVAQGIYSWRAWHNQARNLHNESVVRSLVIGVELYREHVGHYPSSLGELQFNTHLDKRWRESIKDTLKLAVSNAWQDTYSYQAASNGFVITVTGPEMAPAGWFGKRRTMDVKYSQGEALDGR
jgi:hypothetical protein